jgi:hypothetical protein
LQEAKATTIFLTVALQGATMAVDRDKPARLRKQHPTFFIKVDQPHRQLQKHKVPAIILIATT